MEIALEGLGLGKEEEGIPQIGDRPFVSDDAANPTWLLCPTRSLDAFDDAALHTGFRTVDLSLSDTLCSWQNFGQDIQSGQVQVECLSCFLINRGFQKTEELRDQGIGIVFSPGCGDRPFGCAIGNSMTPYSFKTVVGKGLGNHGNAKAGVD